MPEMTLDAFMQRSPLAMARLAPDLMLLGANDAFRALLSRFNAEMPTVPVTHFLAQARRVEIEQQFARLFAGETLPMPLVLEFALPGGEQAVCSVYASLMHPPQGPELVVQLIDTTEQKNLEMKFAHSQKMQAVGQLAGGVAHDFNNLLTAMIGFCDLLLMRHPAGDQSFADIMQIKQNANRAANLVRQLLAFSRRQTLQPKLLDITDVLAELSNLVRRLIGENIELNMVHGRDIGMVKADQGQLEQVIINLAVNARDAMKNGGALTIRTSLATVTAGKPLPVGLIAPAEEDYAIPPGEYVRVEVADKGTGIPRGIIQKIFEPFFSTKEVGSGTGLGLSTVYGIIKQSGGYIYVESKDAVGTTFHLYFPAFAPEEKPVETVENASAPVNADLTGRITILLVEDEAPVRIFAARALRNKGYTVFEADCAETALEVMEREGDAVEMIVSDVIMPGMNGPTMVEKILETRPELKVIFISGYAEDIFVHSYGAERSFNFLAKPFTLKQLAQKVKDVSGK